MCKAFMRDHNHYLVIACTERRVFMAQEKKPVRRRSPKKGTKMLKKLSSLPKAEMAKVNSDDLWIMRPWPEDSARVVRDG